MSEPSAQPGVATATRSPVAPSVPGEADACLRCGFPVHASTPGCKNPCGNCGFVYPLGDCSD